MRIVMPFALAGAAAMTFSSCSQESTAETASNVSATPANPIDALISDYDKAARDLARLEKKHQQGDVSITMRLIDGREQTQQLAAQLKQESPKMTPAQAHQVAEISARTAPYLQ